MRSWRFGVTALALLAGSAGCCKVVARGDLPDGFSVSALSRGQYAFMPLGEAGIEYKFVGVGWALYDQRVSTYSVWHGGARIVSSGTVDPAALPDGWSARSIRDRAIIAGSAAVGEPNSTTAVRYASPETPRWRTDTEPIATLDDRSDMAAFVLDCWRLRYLRALRYGSDRHELIASRIEDTPGSPGVASRVAFSFRDLTTGQVLTIVLRYDPYGGLERLE